MSNGSSASAASFFESVGLRLGAQLARTWPVAAPSPARNVVALASVPAAAPSSGRRNVVATSRRASAALSALPKPGARVSYRQGRGTFNAHVLRVDAAHGTAVLERDPDLKRVVRPLGKIYAPK